MPHYHVEFIRAEHDDNRGPGKEFDIGERYRESVEAPTMQRALTQLQEKYATYDPETRKGAALVFLSAEQVVYGAFF